MRATERQHHAEEELARLTYELDRVEEGRRRLRAALAHHRTLVARRMVARRTVARRMVARRMVARRTTLHTLL